MKNEKVETFLKAFEWAEERGFLHENWRLSGFCNMLNRYLQENGPMCIGDLSEFIDEIMAEPLILKHKPEDHGILYWFKPKNWDTRKEVYLKVKKEYNEQTSL